MEPRLEPKLLRFLGPCSNTDAGLRRGDDDDDDDGAIIATRPDGLHRGESHSRRESVRLSVFDIISATRLARVRRSNGDNQEITSHEARAILKISVQNRHLLNFTANAIARYDRCMTFFFVKT